MFIKEIELIGFRNYLEAKLSLDRQKTIIIGKNAQGKSNLIEVIQLLSYFKSRRAKKDAELINFSLDQAIVKTKIEDAENKLSDFALLIRKSGRRTYKLNDVSKKPKELLHKVLSVSFMSEDLNIINSSPSLRRDYIDSVIKQLDTNYTEDLSSFEKILSQRNSFIKDLVEKGKYYPSNLNQSDKSQLSIWDELFCKAANKVTQSRKAFIKELCPIANKFYQDISGEANSQINIEYTGKELDEESLLESLARDLARSFTNLGPQRDDFSIELNSNSAASFASQGEKRSIILCFKLSELQMLKDKHNEFPILLLDDVLAELDEDRQDFLLDSIDNNAQVIITTTHLGSHLEKWSEDSQIIQIEAGQIISNNINKGEFMPA